MSNHLSWELRERLSRGAPASRLRHAATIMTAASAALSFLAAPRDGRAADTLPVTGTIVAEHGATGHSTGRLQGQLDPATGVLVYRLVFAGLSGPVTMAHFHGPAAPGVDAGVLQPIAPPYASPVERRATLTAAEIRELESGLVYVNLHTAAYPGGEARAQLSVGRG